jgi:hypothetical protein
MVFHDSLVENVRREDSFGMQNTTLETSKTIERVLFVFGGIALFNMIELFVQITFRFKSWKGLYFWSLIISAFGILPYTLGLLFKFFGVIQGYPFVYVAIAMIDVGWHLMVTGQSFVLYSRLHLICQNHRVQRAVLWAIIVNWFISNVPTTVFVFGAASPHPDPYILPYGVWERLQLCLYFTQEVVISCIYGYEVIKMLKPEFFNARKSGQSDDSAVTANSLGRRVGTEANKRILRHLLWINVVIIALDITLLVVEFIGHYEVQVLYKAFVYSVKLKLEFRILNQLTDIAQIRLRSSQGYFGSTGQDSSGSQWDPLASHPQSRRHSSMATAVSHSALARPIGMLPDIEKIDEEQGGEAVRKDSMIPKLETEVQLPGNSPLRQTPAPFLASGPSEGRMSSAVAKVSLTEGLGSRSKAYGWHGS